MEFYSHAKEDEEKGRIGIKELKSHLSHVYHIASGQLHHNLGFIYTNSNFSRILEDICIFHDLGKYTTFFQDYLLDRKKVDRNLKKHSRIGAYCIANKYLNIDFTLALLSYYCIVNHHGNLINIKNTEFFYEAAKESYEKRFNLQK
ncbi:MAG: CRISPR-associated endonuclease Cas3'', partial [bacterium]